MEKICTGDSKLDEKIQEWINWNRNEEFSKEAVKFIKEGNNKLLDKLFLNRLCFGTAGLRGKMGCGYSQMNDLVIIQTTQGLLKWILSKVDGNAPKIIVGYDGRHHSKHFAELVSTIFIKGGCEVYLFSEMVPTPFVSFATELLGDLGVMITASHNPKEDNGYKVYYKHGVQINAPYDKEIEKLIYENLVPEDSSWDTSVVCNYNETLRDPLEIVKEIYYAKLWDGPFDTMSDLKVTYTPMHGVGYAFIVEAFEKSGLKPVIPVEEQVVPDPEFPTVKFPNPEEGKCALNLAIDTANKHNSTLILANDPDADRLALAEKTVNGDWKVFTGNELGAILGWWCFYVEKTTNPNFDPKNIYFLSSSVSSKILNTIAKVEGCNFEETLTGFKWLGKRAYEIVAESNKSDIVIFAFEEAIGFMCGDVVKDKDGISAAVCAAKLATYLKKHSNSTLQEQLLKIYDLYGHHLTENSYYLCHDPVTTKRIFHRLCNFVDDTPKTYPAHILNGKYTIKNVRDLMLGYDSTRPDENFKPALPISKSSPMITFYFTNGLVATFRASGTEPKIKYYTELCATPEQKDLVALRSTQMEMIGAMVDEFLQPELNGLVCRSN